MTPPRPRKGPAKQRASTKTPLSTTRPCHIAAKSPHGPRQAARLHTDPANIPRPRQGPARAPSRPRKGPANQRAYTKTPLISLAPAKASVKPCAPAMIPPCLRQAPVRITAKVLQSVYTQACPLLNVFQ